MPRGDAPGPQCPLVADAGLALTRALPPADPVFLRAHVVPDSSERGDDKLYFFFREKALEGAVGPGVLARVGRVCLVSGAPGGAGGRGGRGIAVPRAPGEPVLAPVSPPER